MPKWLFWLALISVLFLVYTQPGNAGSLAGNLAEFLVDLLDGLAEFVNGLVEGAGISARQGRAVAAAFVSGAGGLVGWRLRWRALRAWDVAADRSADVWDRLEYGGRLLLVASALTVVGLTVADIRPFVFDVATEVFAVLVALLAGRRRSME